MTISFAESPKALRIEKQPYDDRLYTFTVPDLPSGVSLANGSVNGQAKAGNVAGAVDLTFGSVSVSGAQFQVKIGGGTNAEDYKVTFRLADTQNSLIEYDVIFLVRD